MSQIGAVEPGEVRRCVFVGRDFEVTCGYDPARDSPTGAKKTQKEGNQERQERQAYPQPDRAMGEKFFDRFPETGERGQSC